ncbi:MAG: YybH family protein [Vicinamibacterales bacterium]
MKRLMAVVVALLVAFPATLHAQVVMRVESRIAEGAEQELTATRAEYAALLNGRDVTRLAALYTIDALVVLADGERLSGASEVERHFAKVLQPAARNASIRLVPQRFEIARSGELGAESGTFVEAAGEGPVVTGAYVTIYSRGYDGQWRISIDVRTTGAQLPAVIW